MTPNERTALDREKLSRLALSRYMDFFSFDEAEPAVLDAFRFVVEAIEPVIRADERKRAEAEVERLRDLLREALAFIARNNAEGQPLVAHIITALATKDTP